MNPDTILKKNISEPNQTAEKSRDIEETIDLSSETSNSSQSILQRLGITETDLKECSVHPQECTLDHSCECHSVLQIKDGICYHCHRATDVSICCILHENAIQCPDCFKLLMSMDKTGGIRLSPAIQHCIATIWWSTDSLRPVSQYLLEKHPKFAQLRQHVCFLGSYDLPVSVYQENPEMLATNVRNMWSGGNRFVIWLTCWGGHYRLILVMNRSEDDGGRIAWFFDPKQRALPSPIMECLHAFGTKQIKEIVCPYQKDSHSCGPLMFQNAEVILDVIAESIGSDADEIELMLRESFRELANDGPRIRALIRKEFIPKNFFDAKEELQKRGANTGSSLTKFLVEDGEEEDDDNKNLRDKELPTEKGSSTTRAVASTVPTKELKSKAQGMYGEHMNVSPTPYIDPLCGIDFTNSEPSSDCTSGMVFCMLIEDISHCPFEGFGFHLHRILSERKRYLSLLSRVDTGRLTIEIAHYLEAKVGSGRKWSIKNLRALKSGEFVVTVSCSARGVIKPKERGSMDDTNQRDRESKAAGCKRSATLSLGDLSFHFVQDQYTKEEWQHTCPEIHLEGPGSKPGKMMSAEAEARLMVELFQHYKIVGNKMHFVKMYLTQKYSDTMTKDDMSAKIVLFQRFLASRRQGNQCVERFEQELKKNCILGEAVFDQSSYEQIMIGAQWIDKDWPCPSQFCMFLVDGISSFMCREYHLIPILGVAQDFTVSLVCVAIGPAERKEVISRMLDYLEKRDSTIWTRPTFWMSDGGSGIKSALAEKKMVHHRYCLVHKAANLLNHMKEKGVAALGEDLRDAPDAVHRAQQELTRAAKSGEKHLAAWGIDFEKDGEVKEPYKSRTFSSCDDKYAKPDFGPNVKPMEILNWLRNAPVREEFARRLMVYLSKDPKGLQLHVLFLFKTRSVWWQGALIPFPDYGTATNNACEGFLGRARTNVPPNTDLDTLHGCVAALGRSHNIDLKLTTNGKQAPKLSTLISFLPQSLLPLVEHLDKFRVTPFAKVTFLQNIGTARGLVPTLFSGCLEVKHIRALVEHSAFGVRFAYFHVENSEHGLIKRTIRVEDRIYKVERLRNFFIAVMECGSYICSCGHTVQYGGIPCRHVCAALEAGFLAFHAYGNLDPFLILAPEGEELDLSHSFRSRTAHAAENFSVETDLRPINARSMEPIMVRRGANWNPWTSRSEKERKVLYTSFKWATEETTLNMVASILEKVRRKHERSRPSVTSEDEERETHESIAPEDLDGISESVSNSAKEGPARVGETRRSGDPGSDVGELSSGDESGAADDSKIDGELPTKRAKMGQSQISSPQQLNEVNVDDPMRPFTEAVYKVRDLDSIDKKGLLHLFAEHLARYLNKDMSSMFRGNWGAKKILKILKDECAGHNMAQFEEGFWSPCRNALMHAAARRSSPQKKPKSNLPVASEENRPKVALAKIPVRTRIGHSKNSPIEHTFNSGRRRRRKKQES